MDIILDIARRSLATMRHQPALWFFGFFVAAGGGGGGASANVAPSSHHEAAPPWLIPLVVGAVLLGAVGFVMHVLGEAALIEGVAATRRGETVAIRQGLRKARPHFGVVLRLKLACLAMALLGTAVFVMPIVLAALEQIGLAVGIAASLALGVLVVPALVTLYIVYSFALRFAVLEDRHALDALRRARLFLHGRLMMGLGLIVASGVGQIAAGIAGVVALLPAAGLALALYSASGVVPAIIAGAILGLPVVTVIVGALGCYQSTVWTLGYFDGRGS